MQKSDSPAAKKLRKANSKKGYAVTLGKLSKAQLKCARGEGMRRGGMRGGPCMGGGGGRGVV